MADTWSNQKQLTNHLLKKEFAKAIKTSMKQMKRQNRNSFTSRLEIRLNTYQDICPLSDANELKCTFSSVLLKPSNIFLRIKVVMLTNPFSVSTQLKVVWKICL